MNLADERPEAALAVRLAALIAGLGVGGWAALLPSLRGLTGLDAADAVQGAALLAVLLLGAAASATAVDALIRRHGGQALVLTAGLALAALLPSMALATSPAWLGLMLFAFGVAVAMLDAAAQVSADDVQCAVRRPLRAGLNAPRAVGVLAGVVLPTVLQSAGFEPVLAASLLSALMAIAAVVAWPYVLVSERVRTSRVRRRLAPVLVMLAIAAAMGASAGAALTPRPPASVPAPG